jgi:tetratricopeptide (TPR) repeat protein
VTLDAFDPRAVLAGGILALAGIGFAARVAVGPGPFHGARINRALAWQVEGDAARAARELERVAEELPHDAGAWLRLGRALRESGRVQESREALARAASLAPRGAIYEYELAKTLAESNELDAAEESLVRALTWKPKHAGAWALRAGVAASRSDPAHAAEWLTRAESLGLSDPDRVERDRLFDPVRHDPAFAKALLRLRAPDSAIVGEL